MSWPILLTGAVALAALIFALQRLRARPRVVRLGTAMLWAQAAQAAPRRVLVERFDRRLVYLLILAIALLLWFAAARPEPRAAPDGRFHVFYLEAGAPMLAGPAFADAQAALLADAAAIPRDERAVELGSATAVPLLERHEDIGLLRARLARAGPVAAPSDFARWSARIAARYAGVGPVTVHYYGFGPAMADVARSLPAGMRLVAGYLAPALSANRGIVALGASPAVSGRGGADILIGLADTMGGAIGVRDLRLTLDGRRFDPPASVTTRPGSIVLRDVAAAGGILQVALTDGDGFAADDRAALVLPDRRPVRVAIGPDVPAAIRAVVAIDPAMRLVAPGAAQVVIRRAGQSFGGALPAFELSDAATGTAAFAITDPDGDDQATLARDLADTGVTLIDAGALADGSGRAVGAVVARGARRGMAVWSGLFAPQADFATSRAMPPFVSRILRWLAHPAPWIAYAQAGAPLPDASRSAGPGWDAALMRDALNGAIVPGEAGDRRFGDRSVAVALDAPVLTRAAATRVDGIAAATPWRRLPDLLFPALLLVAMVLLGFEWWLLSRRRIP